MIINSSPTARDAGLQRGLRMPVGGEADGNARFIVSDVSGTTLWEEGPTSQPMVLSGITKLYTLAMVLRDFDRGALSPDTRASHILPHNTLAGLCMVGGRDYSDEITISHLLSHRSGISDYLSFAKRGALPLARQIAQRDRSWSFDQALEIARHYPGRFKPGAPGRVHYSDTNYQILGAILKTTTGLSFAQLLDIRIVGPLGLKNTYAFTSERAEKYYELGPITWKKKEIHAPESIASLGANGSVVSTAKELVTFLGAFWAGKLCDESWIPRIWSDTTSLNPRVSMGLGAMTYARRRGHVPLVGHSGFTGSAALIDPTRRLFGAGSLNEIQWGHKPLGYLAKRMEKITL
jgi:D-alanyl-D-alanine carboxypeptidase